MNSPAAMASSSAGDPVAVSVVLVSYNTAALLRPCLDRLGIAIRPLNAQVIVVDNASRDDSVSVLRAHYPQYELVENKVNVGFGRANNQVLGRIQGRFVLLLNTDAYIEPDAIVKSLSYMATHPRCGVLGARLVGEDDQPQPSCRYFPTPWSAFLLRTGLDQIFRDAQKVDDMAWDDRSVRQCDWVPGCFYLVRREVIDIAGLFDPRFFLYYEEVDHCRAVKKAGWEVTYFPEVTVVHLGGESAKSDGSLTGQGRQISSLQAESEVLYFRKHHGATGAWQFLLLSLLADVILIGKSLLRRFDRFSAIDAWRNARQTALVFWATRGGQRETR